MTQSASLPDGREIVVRVAVPDDPYIAKRELEDGVVVATVNTVLDADDTRAAGELARDVAARLSSGELEPTAGAIEPLADELR